MTPLFRRNKLICGKHTIKEEGIERKEDRCCHRLILTIPCNIKIPNPTTTISKISPKIKAKTTFLIPKKRKNYPKSKSKSKDCKKSRGKLLQIKDIRNSSTQFEVRKLRIILSDLSRDFEIKI